MPEPPFFQYHLPKMIVALLLTCASGVVDIVGYLSIFHFFTAHLTGTTVQLGHSLAARQRTDVFVALTIVGAFLVGSLSGRALLEMGARKRIRKIATITISLEAVLLATVALRVSDSINPYRGLGILAAAMGIQTATLTRIGPLIVHTTFVTGMVNKFAQLVSHIAFRAWDLLRAPNAAARAEQRRDIMMALFLASIWICYVAGAVLGTLSAGYWGVHALFIAVAVLGVSLVTDQFFPLSLREEREQSET